MDKIFQEENFVCNFIRKCKSSSGNKSKHIAVEFDYLLCYAKNKQKLTFTQQQVNPTNNPKYCFSDGHEKRRGKYALRDLEYKGTYSKTLDYIIKAPDDSELISGNKIRPPHTWRWSEKKLKWGIENDFIVFKKRKHKWKVYFKQYQFVDNKDELTQRSIPYKAIIDFPNSRGTNLLREILPHEHFSYPKCVELNQFILSLFLKKDITVLDFFAGSGTTLHAVMLQNEKDGGKRNCILITNNQNKICEKVTYERIRRAILGYKKKNGKQVLGLKNNQLSYFKSS